MLLSDFQYDLPEELIARFPLEKRSASRLMCVDKATGNITHRSFNDILSLVSPKDLLVLNNTKVLSARLFGRKETGGQIEVLVERILDPFHALALIRASKSPKIGSTLLFNDHISLQVEGRQDNLFKLTSEQFTFFEILEKIGEIPLPPYFQRSPNETDKERYQTVYAKHEGSVAAPTAGLHFDHELLNALKQKNIEIGYVTLHVGAGTFAPVKVAEIEKHTMHPEYFEVSKKLCEQIMKTKKQGGRVIAVGTTTARSLESIASKGAMMPFKGETNIFIYPGFKFKCVDVLITNLHLPGSTLLMLLAAFASLDLVKKAYQEAVNQKYRFFSYGDAMWVGV